MVTWSSAENSGFASAITLNCEPVQATIGGYGVAVGVAVAVGAGVSVGTAVAVGVGGTTAGDGLPVGRVSVAENAAVDCPHAAIVATAHIVAAIPLNCRFIPMERVSPRDGSGNADRGRDREGQIGCVKAAVCDTSAAVHFGARVVANPVVSH